MFFDSWVDITRTIVLAVLGYTALILTLRISGKRTLAKMNAFDFVVTVALGSILATLMLSTDTALLEGSGDKPITTLDYVRTGSASA